MKTVHSSYRIIFMGTPVFAVPSLKALVEAGYNVVGVVTQPAKPKGRGRARASASTKEAGRKTTPTPVKEYGLEKGITVFEPQNIKDPDFIESMKTLSPDFIVVVAYGKILPARLLDVPRFKCINLHASLLPAYRGAGPINWAIINGEAESGVTTMLMDVGMDTGDMLEAVSTPIGEQESAGQLSERLSVMGAPLVLSTLELIVEGNITPKAQDGTKATYAPMLKKTDGVIDWTLDARRLGCRVRGLNPWPGTFTFWNGKLLKVYSGVAVENGSHDASVTPGTVVNTSERGIDVQCADGVFRITRLQLEGKKAVDAEEFVRGYRVEKEVFG